MAAASLDRSEGPRGLGYLVLVVGLLLAAVGCRAVTERLAVRQKRVRYDQVLASAYNQIVVDKSLTLDVLPKLENRPGEVVSQTESLIASVGQSPDTYRMWFTMVGFHEYKLSVVRKYFLLVDERIGGRAERGLRFDCQMLIPKEIASGEFSSEADKQVSLLKAVRDTLLKDVSTLSGGAEAAAQANKTLDLCGMILKQTFELVLVKLADSPVLVPQLASAEGVAFEHINFDKGLIRMVTQGQVVSVSIRLGAMRNWSEQAVVVSGSAGQD